MEALRRARRPVRREFDGLHRELEGLLKEVPLKEDVIRVKYRVFSDTIETLHIHDGKILEQLTSEVLTEAEEDKEFDEIREFKFRAESIRVLKEKLLPIVTGAGSVTGGTNNGDGRGRNFKLPPIQVSKFTGEPKDWLRFWGQFQKIDEDTQMLGSDKLWYLLQYLDDKTDAYEMAVKYPPSNENYVKVIEALKKQYGDEDLLLQVYVRELLNLVIKNVKSNEKTPVKSLHLQLDSHLRALKTLNLEKADPATWLFPLVESSLPEKVQDNWQRSPLSTQDGSQDNPPRTRLDLLMSFLEREVEIGRRVDIAKTFAEHLHDNRAETKMAKTGNQERRTEKRKSIPTLTSFHAAVQKKCVFCPRTNHNSEDCFKAKRMTYDEKMKILRTQGLCFRCCGPHLGRNCQENNLECSVCKKRHFTVICKEYQINNDKGAPPAKRSRTENENTPKGTMANANLECSSDVALQMLMVKIGWGNQEKIVRAFIDSGSQRSYLLKSTAEKIGLKSKGTERVIHSLFGGRCTAAVTHNRFEVRVSTLADSYQTTFKVREYEKLCGKIPRVADYCPKVVEELRRRNVVLSDVGGEVTRVELLIGADMYAKIILRELIELNCGGVAINTKLGWTLLGEVANSVFEDSMANLSLTMSVTDVCVSNLWELENLGIQGSEVDSTVESQETEAKSKFRENITRLPSGRYSVKLPWREEHGSLPSNREVAFKRLQSASRKLWAEGLFQAYETIFKDWENEGFIERVPEDEKSACAHYLPHRPVIKTSSLTTPVRPVFDASCRVARSSSLNDCLVKGENLIQLIPDLIQGFRENRVAFVSDIRKAFQMIAVDTKDRDFMRFLWWKESDMTELIEYRHARVMFGATCSPFILAAVITFHLENLPEEDRELGEKLLRSLYVDNCVSSEPSLDGYRDFKEKSTEIMKRAGMDLRLWQSNVDEGIDESSRVISVLGLLWDRILDQLFVNVAGIKMPDRVTKRNILSTVQKIFDPIGITSPALIPMKLILQRTWISKVKWDEQLPESERREFLGWFREIEKLGQIRIPRLSTAGVDNKDHWELHIFVDASKNAYSAAVFLRTSLEDQVSVQLLAAKSKIAPVKVMTIPKLELMGCFIGARLSKSVKRAFRVTEMKEVYWTDSTTALAWIRRNNQWGTFVANRVKEIRALTRVADWRHVPGIMNPADLPSRGTSPSSLLSSKWWEGPYWLYENENCWPSLEHEDEVNEDEVIKEERKSVSNVVASLTVMDCVKQQHSFAGLVRIMGWVRRFLHNKFVEEIEKRKQGPLSKEELRRAELILIREIQREAFPPEDRTRLKGLDVTEDDWGILRQTTRLTYRKVPNTLKYPIILPGKRAEVKQLIRDYHRSYCHAGPGFLLTKLREKYWILKGRQSIINVISKCVPCRKLRAKAVIPKAAPLPLDRVKDAEVFEVVGLDMAGPMTMKNGSKMWMLIFTCAVYRAVHFELLKSANARSFIAALGNFIRKYRRPAIIYSDNGTNFRGADNLFRKLDWKAIENDKNLKQIEFKFNPVTAAWWGGWWERLIGTAKDLLKRTVGKGSLNMKELDAVIRSVAEVMNGRPLTYVSENPEDLEPLTPALFLHPFGNVEFPEEEMTEAQQLRFRLAYVDTLKKELKNRFLKEYLAHLINRSPKKPTRNLCVGELVLVGSDQKKRVEWPLGRVLELIPGTDGNCRVAKVKTKSGEIVRAVQRLYPLEMDYQDEVKKIIRENVIMTRSGRRVKAPVRYM